MTGQVSAIGYLQLGESPRLVAVECAACGALYFDRRNACAACSGTRFGRRVLADLGTVRAFTVVHRAAPGLPTPYTSIVVDLDGGGVVKGNLIGVTDPALVAASRRVRLTTFTAGADDNGVEAVAFGFEQIGAP